MTNYDCDILVIGLGPAGMAVSIMAQSMGLKVCAIEARKIGGECLNVGCIPSKALLKTAKLRHSLSKFSEMGLEAAPLVRSLNPFARVREVVQQVNQGKTAKMFEKMDLILGQGRAAFIDSHTVEVPGVRKVSARKIFICCGTTPRLPSIPGIENVAVLTNDNLYELNAVPESLLIIGGGAIGCEMGQAISRLGARVTILNADARLLPRGDAEASQLLLQELEREGIKVINNAKIKSASSDNSQIVLELDNGNKFKTEKLLVAAGRNIALGGLQLERAGVRYDNRSGIQVDKYLRTTQKHIYAVGDCNGYRMFTHAAMHQGMLALINAMTPWPFKREFRKYLVPWSVFTEPEVSQVGFTESELQSQNMKYEKIITQYADYGRSSADGSEIGFIKALVTSSGKIQGVTIVGENSSEMIQEFSLAMQSKKSLLSILFLQHSFPTYSFMNKRIAEIWLMNKIKSKFLQKLIRIGFLLN